MEKPKFAWEKRNRWHRRRSSRRRIAAPPPPKLKLRHLRVQGSKFRPRMRAGCGGSCSTRAAPPEPLQQLWWTSRFPRHRKPRSSNPFTRTSPAKVSLTIKLSSLSLLLRFSFSPSHNFPSFVTTLRKEAKLRHWKLCWFHTWILYSVR